MINKFLDKTPNTKQAIFIAWNSDISGDVILGDKSSIWFSVTIRGDIAPIRIGSNTNIQDSTVCHVSTAVPLIIGNNVTVGHNSILHSCTIKDFCLIGMGAIILDKAVIGHHSIVGAGSLVTGKKVFPPKSLIMGSPAKVVRELTNEDIDKIYANAERYVKCAQQTKISRES